MDVNSRIITDGKAGVTVGSATETSLLSASSIHIAKVRNWGLAIKPVGDDITVRVYKAFGPNVGFSEITALTVVVTDGDVHVIEFADETAFQLKVTAQAASGTAAVSCDYAGVA